jgi:hypothetical protein
MLDHSSLHRSYQCTGLLQGTVSFFKSSPGQTAVTRKARPAARPEWNPKEDYGVARWIPCYKPAQFGSKFPQPTVEPSGWSYLVTFNLGSVG